MAVVSRIRVLLFAGLLTGLLVLAVSLTAGAEPVAATYYGEAYVGAPTASGELYDPYGFTAAHPYLALGTELVVNYNGRSVIVRVNDRCACGLDLSLAAAQAIGLTDVGAASVDMQILEPQASLPQEIPNVQETSNGLQPDAIPIESVPSNATAG